ncbi:MAG: 2-succinyl-5-enolpyruvyl-6-hydroxy-3-cyclohexene-1-carboxylic-acid synthase [Acidimicrobiales bacterium]
MSVEAGGPPQPEVQVTFCRTLADEWERAGVTDAVICPGSRSTPLVLGLAGSSIRVHVRLDERSAGFFALGIALITRRPVVVCTTSGTAAVELHASVVEGHHAKVPLIVCTADRPPRMHDFGASQTVDQSSIFSSALRWHQDPGVPSWPKRQTWRSLAARAAIEASLNPLGPGPVHLNLPFEEPLVGATLESAKGAALELPAGRDGGRPWHAVQRPHQPLESDAVFPAADSPQSRVAIIAGGGCGDPRKVLAAAASIGAPVLADPLSGCRRRHPNVVGAADSILRDDRIAQALRPDVVIRLGKIHSSKVLATRLHEWSSAGTVQVLLDGHWAWTDPDRDSSVLMDADPEAWCDAVVRTHPQGTTDNSRPRIDDSWLRLWASAEIAAQQAISEWCDEHAEVTEPAVARRLFEEIEPNAKVVVAASMPMRDLEWYSPVLADMPVVLANRGANGIDGVVSTAMGVASGTEEPVYALVGDLAFLHDLTAFVGDEDRKPTVIVIDNSGGGIFSFLPQRGSLDEGTFESFFGTPQSHDVAQVARGLGAQVEVIKTMTELRKVLAVSPEPTSAAGATDAASAPRVIVIKAPDRDTNVRHHDDINQRVADRVSVAIPQRP